MERDLAARITAMTIKRVIAHAIPTSIINEIIPKRCIDQVAVDTRLRAVSIREPPAPLYGAVQSRPNRV